MTAPAPFVIGHSPFVIPRRRRGGFALLITVTLLAFLVLLLVSLASLTRVETQVAGNNRNLAQARQHALMALNIALGQLQKHAGPDRRVTAAADISLPAGAGITSTTPADAARVALDAYWAEGRNRHWTGVWTNAHSPAYVRAAPAGYNALPGTPVWLVSGNENTAGFTPENLIAGLAAESAPADAVLDGAGRPHRLLVKNAALAADTASLHRAVTAPEVPIVSASAPGHEGDPVTIGHYAWWIGDEGVKARANLVDRHAAGSTAADLLRRRSVVQRFAIEAITSDGTDGLALFYPANDARLPGVIHSGQLALLDPAPLYQARLKTHFHDLTMASRGVLSDVKNGGLKRDLSYILGQPDIARFRAALNAAYESGAPAPLSTYNPVLSPTATPYATLPENAHSVITYDGPAGIFAHSATWEQLWSYHNQGNLVSATPAGAFNPAGEAVPRRQTATRHGVYPLLIQAKLFYRLRIVGGTPDGDGVNRSGDIWVDIIPLAVVANPYGVDLAAADYTLVFTGVQPLVRYGATTPMGGTPAAGDFPRIDGLPNTDGGRTSENNRNLPNAYTGQIRLVLRSTGIPAGQAQVFTIDPAANAGYADDRIEITSATDARQVILTNDYDPVPALTYNFSANTPATTKRIPADKSHVALYCAASQMNAALHMDYAAAEGHRRATQVIRGQGLDADANFLLVDPLSDGVQQGGGFMLAVNEALTPATPAIIPGRPYQQALFYQLNYRGLIQTFSGSDGVSHPVEWARTYAKRGSTGGPGTTPNDFIEANLLYPEGDPRTVRWGLVNLGEGPTQTTPPASIGGASAGDVGYRTILYDLPTPGNPLSSLGQLRHFNTAGHVTAVNALNDALLRHNHVVHAWQVNQPVANSYPHPRVPRDQVFNYTLGMGYHYDGSYLWNDLLWDRFYFSTYPASGPFDFATDRLVNARHRPFRDPAVVPGNAPEHFRGADADPSAPANSRMAAQNLLVEGAFNINSTSVEAWKTLFAGLRGVPAGSETAAANLTAPFARTLHQSGGADDARAGNTVNAWTGIHNFSQTELDDLAEEMVMQVRRRGPFLSLADFVNRRLVSASDGNAALGLSGALQAALDRVVNRDTAVASPFNVTSDTSASRNQLADQDYLMPTALSGFPGYVLQADLLAALGPVIAARSDTFTIRTYGDVVNPATGNPEGRAWCEAIVQRTPDYVASKNGAAGNAPHENATDPVNAEFGRRYEIVSFRWLNPADL